MPVHIFVAPAAAGKTSHVLNLAWEAAVDLNEEPRVCVPTRLQAQSWHRRLAERGGAIGVRVMTFDDLYSQCLDAAGVAYCRLSESVQLRLLRAILEELPLRHYAPLIRRRGFLQCVERIISELKAAQIWPAAFAHFAGRVPRLAELAHIYTEYQRILIERAWADRAGLGWLAVETLDESDQDIGPDWRLLIVDGFDSFTTVQLEMLYQLRRRVGKLIITLTGEADGNGREATVYRRFVKTRRQLETVLDCSTQVLPQWEGKLHPSLRHLEEHLFVPTASQVSASGAVTLIEASDRSAEVRAAMRWLKERMMYDDLQPMDVALLARNIPAYRTFILQVADEFGIPIHLVDGLPLGSNPAVTAILGLLEIMLPLSPEDEMPSLPRRPVVEMWRSPYFDWNTWVSPIETQSIGIREGDADKLDVIARWTRVIGGKNQWDEGFDVLGEIQGSPGIDDDEERRLPTDMPAAEEVQRLRGAFDGFVARLTPPSGAASFREYVAWLEDLIGQDDDRATPGAEERLAFDAASLRVMERVKRGDERLAVLDWAALRALKDVLRGLVWSEEAVPLRPAITYVEFVTELKGAVDAAVYHAPLRADTEHVLVADVVQARGLPFRAVGILGLAEGEFPAALGEDPFLRDVDRDQLCDGRGESLPKPTESAEMEFFYESIIRASDALLITRPRLAEDGAPWVPSPYWEEVCRLVKTEITQQTGDYVPPPALAASWPELWESLAIYPDKPTVQCWAEGENPGQSVAQKTAADILRVRQERQGGEYDGDLGELAGVLGSKYGAAHRWSASRLEAFTTCPLFFFFSTVLGLERREEPREGLDARQLGGLYHQILEEVYRNTEIEGRRDAGQLISVLNALSNEILEAAPRRYGFRATAWWSQTRQEIIDRVTRTLTNLCGLEGDYVPIGLEKRFGQDKPFVVSCSEGEFRLRGIIDRVDCDLDGKLRIIDYKSSHPSSIEKRDLDEGRKVQLPLYAMAARDALHLGEPADGFYWHVMQAERSKYSLAETEGGIEAAFQIACESAWQTTSQVREGRFTPQPLPAECPSYCPGASFCWHYSRGWRG